MSKDCGFVYFIGDKLHTGIKVGYSKKPERRLKQLQTSNASKLEILYLIENSTKETEKYYHRMFSSYLNISGEWYDYKFVYDWIQRRKLSIRVLREEGLVK